METLHCQLYAAYIHRDKVYDPKEPIVSRDSMIMLHARLSFITLDYPRN